MGAYPGAADSDLACLGRTRTGAFGCAFRSCRRLSGVLVALVLSGVGLVVGGVVLFLNALFYQKATPATAVVTHLEAL